MLPPLSVTFTGDLQLLCNCLSAECLTHVPAAADVQLKCDLSAPGGRQSRCETTLLAHQPVLSSGI